MKLKEQIKGLRKSLKEGVDKNRAKPYDKEIEVLIKKYSKNPSGVGAVMSDVADKVGREIAAKHSGVSMFDVFDYIVSKHGVTKIGR